MLSTAAVVRAVARTLLAQRNASQQQQPQPPIVIDPVCVSTSGYTLLEHEAIGALIEELFPLAAVLTPNIDEAVLLLRRMKPQLQHQEPASILSIGDMVRIACELRCALGGGAVLLKGGHVPRGSVKLADVVTASAETGTTGGAAVYRIRGIECEGMVQRPDADVEILLRAAKASPHASGSVEAALDGSVVVDVLCELEDGECVCTLFVRQYLDSSSTHGTGCTLSAALACALANGEPRE